MDMLIKAIANARRKIEFAEGQPPMREDVETVLGYSTVLHQAVSIAEELGCEETDVDEARRQLVALAAQYGRCRAAIRKAGLAAIDRQAEIGRSEPGMTPVESNAQLYEHLRASVDLIRTASHGKDVTLTVGHQADIAVPADSIMLDENRLTVGKLSIPLGSIVAIRRLDGIVLLADDTVMVIHCDGATPGMSPAQVRRLTPGTIVTVLEETSGEGADRLEHVYPTGTAGEVTEVRDLPSPQGLSVTVVIGPQDGEEAIVNVFDEGDAWFPLATVEADARTAPHKAAVDETGA